MRTRSVPWFVGLCLSVAACSGAGADPAAAEASDPTPPAEVGTDEGPAASNAAPAGDGAESPPTDDESLPPDEDASTPPSAELDAGAQDAASDGGKQQIPKPTFGKLHASAQTGDVCDFTVNGIARGTSTVLDISLVTGNYVVACKRADGAVASEPVTISANQTSTVVLEFPANGTLVMVAVGGTCAFSVNGAAKGTTSSLKLSVAPGSYSVACKPSTGAATMSRTVTVGSGETSMAMFKL